MNINGKSHMHFHINTIVTAQSWYDQYEIGCYLRGEVPLTLKQARMLGKKKKKRWS